MTANQPVLLICNDDVLRRSLLHRLGVERCHVVRTWSAARRASQVPTPRIVVVEIPRERTMEDIMLLAARWAQIGMPWFALVHCDATGRDMVTLGATAFFNRYRVSMYDIGEVLVAAIEHNS